MRCRMKLFIDSQTSIVQQSKFDNKLVISSLTLLGICLFFHAGFNVKQLGNMVFYLNSYHLIHN